MKHSRQKTAYWTQKTHLFRADEYICSSCGLVADRGYGTCPGCGSRMKKSEYDPSWVDEMEFLDMIFDD